MSLGFIVVNQLIIIQLIKIKHTHIRTVSDYFGIAIIIIDDTAPVWTELLPSPVISDEIRVQLSERYIELYNKLTGNDFNIQTGSVKERILNNLIKAGYLK